MLGNCRRPGQAAIRPQKAVPLPQQCSAAAVLAVARDQHQADRQRGRQRQRDGAEVEEIDDGGVAQQRGIAGGKDLGVRHLGDGGRDDRGRRHDQHVERRQAARPWRAPAGRARASCRRNRRPIPRSRARCARARWDRYRRRAGAAGRDEWRRPPAARCRPWR